MSELRELEPSHWVDINDVATDEEIAAEKVPESGAGGWEQHAEPFLELLKLGAQHMKAFKMLAVRKHIPVKFAEEVIFWLENRGQIVAFKRWDGVKAYHLPGVEVDAEPSTPKETPMPTTEGAWLSTADAAALLDVRKTRLIQLFNAKTITSRGEGRAREWNRGDLMKYRASRGTKAAPPPQREEKLVPRKPTVKKTRAQVDTSAVADQIRWVLRGQHLGQFAAEEALERISGIVGA